MTLKEQRIYLGLTQTEVSKLVNIPLRTYKDYENNPARVNSIKYKYILEKLLDFGRIDESHGVLTLDQIKRGIFKATQSYEIDFCYLFGSYARNEATPNSDVDLIISTKTTGLQYYGLVETLRQHLLKKVDVILWTDLSSNPELIYTVLKDGIKIVGKGKE
ncbi:MAG: nucleotidyltransferase domain-containing protein [Acholeplasma sp.]|nr:nucleotidyltransferase domain-containing protein [Acholeplasma sp.]